MSTAVSELCTSKKFLVLIVAIATYILVRSTLDVSKEEAEHLLYLVGLWICAQGASDFGKAGRPSFPGKPGKLTLVN